MAGSSISSTSSSLSSSSSVEGAAGIASATPPPDRNLQEEDDTSQKVQAKPVAQQPSSSSYIVSSYFIAGAVAGAASRTAVAPLERLKIIYQCQGNSHAYGGVISALRKIWREEGMKGMFRGNGINCLRIMPYSAVQFTAYETFKKLFTQDGAKELDTPHRLGAGALAGICSVVATYPLDLVRSRLSIVSASIGTEAAAHLQGGAAVLGAKREAGMLGMTMQVWREERGIRGLYKGIGPTAAGVAPYVALNFTFYSLLKDYFIYDDGRDENGTLRKLGCGATAGAISQTLTYPLDVLRRKMQVTGMKGKVDFQYKNSFDAIATIVRLEGLRGLYTGLFVNLLKVSPSMGISFISYEWTKELLSKERGL